jgi:nitrite reductase (NADH) small subunit
MNQERAIGHLSQIPLGEGRNSDVGGTVVTVFRTRKGGLFITQSNCPHRQGPPADGLLSGTTLVCLLHDTTFDPCTGESVRVAIGCEPTRCAPPPTAVFYLI